VGSSEKQSILEAIEHLFAKNREILPLFLGPALPMKDEWNRRPYLGVFPRVLRALQSKAHKILAKAIKSSKCFTDK
jgi:hypothetical protein